MKKLTSLFCMVIMATALSGLTFGQQHHDFILQVKAFNEKGFGEFNPTKNTTHNHLMAPLKMATLNMQKLDSIVFQKKLKEVYNYYNDSKLEQFISYIWSENNWVIKEKHNYTYTEKQKLKETVITGKEENPIRLEYVYDSEDNLSCYLYYKWINNEWANYWKIDYEYDSSGKELNNIEYIWEINDWKFFGKNEFEYDDAQNHTGTIYSRWKNNQWANEKSSEIGYNEEGLQSYVIIFSWVNGNRINSKKHESSYDTHGNLNQTLEYIWKEEKWDFDLKEDFEYDSSGNKTAHLSYKWIENDWVGEEKTASIYDEFGNRNTYTIFKWDNNEWTNNLKTENYYECTIPYNELILPFATPPDYDNRLLFRHKLTQISEYKSTTDDWALKSKYNLYYSEFHLTQVDETKIRKQVLIYPNPATDNVNFNLPPEINKAKFELYNAGGKLVYNGICEQHQPIPVGAFHRGLYSYRLYAGSTCYTGKILLK